MKQGPIPGVNIAHNTASKGYRRGELDDDSTPVNRPLNIAHNTLPQVFARMGLLPQVELTKLRDESRKTLETVTAWVERATRAEARLEEFAKGAGERRS
jgi:hypothetical protein